MKIDPSWSQKNIISYQKNKKEKRNNINNNDKERKNLSQVRVRELLVTEKKKKRKKVSPLIKMGALKYCTGENSIFFESNIIFSGA